MTSKTAAITAARKHGGIWGHGTSWTVSSPYDVTDPDGAVSETRRDSYAAARFFLTRERARIALALLGRYQDQDAVMRLEMSPDQSLRGIVDYVLART